MPLIIDPTRDGFKKVLRHYQIEALNQIWGHTGDGMTSREVYEAVNERLVEDSISRASIINFLNAMSDEYVLDFEEETCKGGMRRKYVARLDESEFKKYIVESVLNSLLQDFPDETLGAIRDSLSVDQLKGLSD